MLLLLLLALCFVRVQALEVSYGSNYLAICDGPSLVSKSHWRSVPARYGLTLQTFHTNITCIDSNYQSTSEGTIMRKCLECEQNSTAVDEQASSSLQNNDIYWFLFNMKYTLLL